MQNIDQNQTIKKELNDLLPLFKNKTDDFDWWILSVKHVLFRVSSLIYFKELK